MTMSRWKIMAGMFGLSLGGLAAVAGPGLKKCTDGKCTASDAPSLVFNEPPLVVPASATMPAAPAAQLVVPAAPVMPAVELPQPVAVAAPATPAVLSLPSEIPSLPPISLPNAGNTDVSPPPASFTLPIPPAVSLPIVSLPTVSTASAVMKPVEVAPSPVEVPAPAPKPAAIAVEPPAPAPVAAPSLNLPVYSVGPPTSSPAEAAVPSIPVETPAVEAKPMVTPSLPAPVAAAPEAPAKQPVAMNPKYRITLRVGEGDPVFEVRCGDELMMKVMSEKVDVKSPTEKGQTLSAVRAVGKVRFVGFGAEGLCDELSFLAGTGEVSLHGNVKVQVKDKLGRVETELSGDKMNYRLDAASSLTGGLQP